MKWIINSKSTRINELHSKEKALKGNKKMYFHSLKKSSKPSTTRRKAYPYVFLFFH